MWISENIYMKINYIQTKCGKYIGISCGIQLFPQYTVMDTNNVMYVHNIAYDFTPIKKQLYCS